MVYVTLTNNSMINFVGHYFLDKMIQLERYGCFVYFHLSIFQFLYRDDQFYL